MRVAVNAELLGFVLHTACLLECMNSVLAQSFACD